jgi:hypothetical protein
LKGSFFLNKAAIKKYIKMIFRNSKVIINADDNCFILHDILDLIKDLKKPELKKKNIKVKLKGFEESTF